MKKIAVVLAVLMLLGAAPAWCLSETADTFIQNRMQSDLRPVEDTGRILDVTNRGIDKTYHTVTDPMQPVLDPVRQVRDETVKGSKSVINVVWDAITLRSMREHKE